MGKLKRKGDFFVVPADKKYKEVKLMNESHAQEVLDARERLRKKKGY